MSETHLSLLSTGSTDEDPSQHNGKIVDWVVKNQIKQTNVHSMEDFIMKAKTINFCGSSLIMINIDCKVGYQRT